MASNEIQSVIFPVVQFFVALITTAILTPFIISFAKKKHIFDQPDILSEDNSRKVHKDPTPRLGGMAMIIGFLTASLLTIYHNPFGIILLSSILIFLLGLYDDLKNISARTRLIAQICIALFAVIFGNLALTRIYLTPGYFLDFPHWLGIGLSVFVIVGAINAANMIDGLDGLAGGIILITITLLSYVLLTEFHDYNIIVFISLPLAGAILGFLKYNTHPAAIFMGDGGSNWLGFFSGVLILLSAGSAPVNNHIAPLVSILLCFAIPILDTLFVITARILKGRSPIFPDQLHFHHGLLKMGLTQMQTISLMYFLAMVLGIAGILPLVFPRYASWVIPYTAPFVFLLLLYYILKKEKSAGSKTPLYSLILDKDETSKLRSELSFIFKLWERFNRFILYFILIITPIITGGIKNQTIGYLAGMVFLILGILSFFKKHGSGSDFLHSFVLSAGALILLVSNNLKPIHIILLDQKYRIQDIYNLIFIILSISILLYIILTFQKKYLLITPTDFLMLALPLMLLLMPPDLKKEWNLNIIAIRSIVLFTAIRTLIKRHEDFQERIRMIIMVSLGFLFFTGVLGMKIVY
jgi:UDP-GlcNAc:undecaprenyl-phosphate GlcNAc-1-phosphate transferase